tara:strand:- start:1294 stop:1962 length:669 start_codon:yes stop_codon:yes gene_type:complete
MIIGICGLIGSGKGTVADILVEQGFKKVSFADKLKDGVATVFGWDRAMLEGDTDDSREWREKEDTFWTKETGRKITPRIVLQEFGTDCMRDGFFDGIWVSLLKKEVLQNPGNYIVPDVRFRNEQNMIRDIGGQIWWAQRGELPEWWGLAILDNNTGSDTMSNYEIHSSEYKWADTNDKFDTIIYNNSTLDSLKRQVLDRLVSNQTLSTPDCNLDIQFSDYGC